MSAEQKDKFIDATCGLWKIIKLQSLLFSVIIEKYNIKVHNCKRSLNESPVKLNNIVFFLII